MLLGLHHVTAICGPAQANVDAYAGALGLRLVKQTVNFDDPGTYHLYYADGDARPGSVLTVFPWPADGLRGQIGAHIDAGGGLAEAYYVDQSPFAHLDTFEELATKNAGRVYEQMEWE